MPIPKPKKDETQKDYVSRFMKSSAAKEYSTQEQAAAVAYNTWRRAKKKRRQK